MVAAAALTGRSGGHSLKETWKPIPIFPGYEVSDHGRVRSFWKQSGLGRGYGRGGKFVLSLEPQRILAQGKQRNRLTVCLRKNNKSHTRLVHRIVLLVFKGPCPKGMEACHNDGDEGNNCLINLRWDTHKNNCADMVRHGTRIVGENHYQSKLSEKEVIEIKKLYSLGYTKMALAKQFNVSSRNIFFIVNNNSWQHAGDATCP